MKNVSHKKGCNLGENPAHVEPPPTPLINETVNGKACKYSVKLKMRRYTTSSTLDLYGFEMYFFDHGKQLQHKIYDYRESVDGR